MKKQPKSKKVVSAKLSPSACIKVPAVWEVKLTEHLNAVFVLWVNKYKVKLCNRKRFAQQTIREIVAGVKFCQAQQPQIHVVKTTLSRTFNIGDKCGCLLAKGVGGNYLRALKQLGITDTFSERIGCGEPDRWLKVDVLPADDGDPWTDCYNTLWRATGKFFKAHPEFEVS
jgi:hypothetical protein